MFRRALPAIAAWAVLGTFGAHAQAPAPVGPPGAAPPTGQVGPPPVIPVRTGPPVINANAGAPQASPAAIPTGQPVPPPPGVPQPGVPQPPPGGIPGVVGAAVDAVFAPAPPPARREPGENEVELTRPDYRTRLAACLQFRADCSVRGLSRSDQDYMRYELRGQRLSGMMLEEVLDARMTQFGSDVTVIAPKRAGNPDWHAEMARTRPAGAAAGSGYAMSNTEAQHESGNARTRYVPWPRQKMPERKFGVGDRPDLD